MRRPPDRKKTQYFENNASRGIYHDGWFACTFGPFIPWDTPGTAARLKDWDANKDVWELYDLTKDFSQADDLAAKEPERLAKMKELFLAEAKANKALPIGGGLWTRFHPEDVIASPYKSWRFDATTTRMPEFTAPGLGKRSNHVTIDVEVGEDASGVLYALGGASGGLTLYMDKGQLVYEYNMLIIERTTAKSEGQARARQAQDRGRRDDRQARRAGGRGAEGGRQGSRPHHREADGAGGLHRQRDVRRRRRSRLARVARLLRPAPFKFDGTIASVEVRLK